MPVKRYGNIVTLGGKFTFISYFPNRGFKLFSAICLYYRMRFIFEVGYA